MKRWNIGALLTTWWAIGIARAHKEKRAFFCGRGKECQVFFRDMVWDMIDDVHTYWQMGLAVGRWVQRRCVQGLQVHLNCMVMSGQIRTVTRDERWVGLEQAGDWLHHEALLCVYGTTFEDVKKPTNIWSGDAWEAILATLFKRCLIFALPFFGEFFSKSQKKKEEREREREKKRESGKSK